MQENKELLKPKIDVVFHSLFRVGNENITKAIISAVTKEKINRIDLNNDRHILGRYPEEKLGILDLRATLDDGTICNVEIQLADNKDTAERFLYYWSRIYSSQLIKGDDYGKINKVIGIIIIDYEFDKTIKIEDLSTMWKITEVSKGEEIELTDVFELYIIELPKAKRIIEKDASNKLAQWMLFLNNPNEKEVANIMNENKEIKEAMNELEEMSKDEELRRVAELREKAIRDEKNGLRHAREDGLREGIKEGIEKNNKEVAKKMKEKHIPIETIEEITKLTKEEIENL
ncbi:MAG: Rpn family recombination-promoting nuclease/putative transposase [Clostridia bacterium]|nr:Rpn family recombination-promoting nuclease/putative transposase [Clostridia bacterium]